MTEKRSDYRKKIKQKKGKSFFKTIKSAFDDSDEEVDVNPDFTRDEADQDLGDERKQGQKEQPRHSRRFQPGAAKTQASSDKALRLKKKLNRAILVVAVLIVLVLVALFHL